MPIVHVAVTYTGHRGDEMFREILDRFGAHNCDENGRLPLHHALIEGTPWQGRASLLVKRTHPEELYGVDPVTELNLF